jgi:tetratricopeptide (TPR) repeat protein
MKALRLQLFLALATFCGVHAQPPVNPSNTPDTRQPNSIEITTSSAEARARFEHGLAQMDTLHREAALQEWRDAARVDPKFALAHIFLAMLSRDPAEQVKERERALATRKFAGKEERLIIDWIANSNQSRWVPAIQAMNEALHEYPRDKYLAWLGGLWLTSQRQSERAILLFERAASLDSHFADPLNQAAYCYARLGNFEKASADMQHYAELLPTEANPQDSLGEISRMAGKFDEALAHFHSSLEIDPQFVESQIGLGDTYALMQEEDKAREEYARAMKKALTRVQATTIALQSASTYAREHDFAKADAAFQEIAKQAHKNDLGALEAEAWRMMSVYQKDNSRAMELLAKSESVVHEPHTMSAAAREQELALILRTRVGRAVHDGSMSDAHAALKRLEAVAATNSSGLVQFSFNGAQGSVLLAQGQYQEAIGRLEDDDRNPFSIQRLIIAYQKTGAADKAEKMAQRLANFYEPTIEQAVVVPEFRKTSAAMKDSN